jgi:hypothetical protein
MLVTLVQGAWMIGNERADQHACHAEKSHSLFSA